MNKSDSDVDIEFSSDGDENFVIEDNNNLGGGNIQQTRHTIAHFDKVLKVEFNNDRASHRPFNETPLENNYFIKGGNLELSTIRDQAH